MKTLHVKKGDLVKIIAGKEKGKTGRVLRVFPEASRAIVERANMIKRHTKPNQKDKLGGIVEKEGSLHVSNLMLVCPQTNKPTRVRMKLIERAGGKGNWVRQSVRSGELIDKA